MSIKKQRETEVVSKILKIVGIGTLVVVASVLAPTFPYAVLRMYLKKKFNKTYSRNELYGAVHYLKRKKFIAYENQRFVLTKLGNQHLYRKDLNNIVINKIPWDNKWRVVTFDIPQEKLAARHSLRKRLKSLGFYHFQKSVFIIPYPCERELDELTLALGVFEYVHIFVSYRFRNDETLLAKFKI